MTTRKQCQLKYAIDCIKKNNTRSYVVEHRGFMYNDQHNMLNYNEKNLVIPPLILHHGYLVLLRGVKEISRRRLNYTSTNVGICKSLVNLIPVRIFNILSLKLSETILGD